MGFSPNLDCDKDVSLENKDDNQEENLETFGQKIDKQKSWNCDSDEEACWQETN